ncbi:MAG: RNA polymerase sigma factor [Marinilabiliaceae bacterium]|nr:RNA polymerase sigma factor [Marinilabiliaceae bacterium]
MNENEIINDIIKGNKLKYSLLVEKNQQMIFRACLGLVHHHEDAEDLTQEVFIKAYQALVSFKGDSSFSTWLYRIAINLSLTHLRKKKNRNIISSIEELFKVRASTDNNPESDTINNEQRTIIEKAIDSLPENQKIAFTLSKYDELKQAEIAEIMMISEGAVESLLQRAKKNLQKKLSQYKKK